MCGCQAAGCCRLLVAICALHGTLLLLCRQHNNNTTRQHFRGNTATLGFWWRLLSVIAADI